MKVAIIGGGAAGLFAAGHILQKGHDVTIFDGNEKTGKKLFITGKGRCNFTNDCDRETFLSNIVRGGKFFQSALSRFNPQDCIAFFEEQGVPTKVERGNRAFPASDKSSDILKALNYFASGAKVMLNHKVKNIFKKGETFSVDGEIFDRVIIATGGKSYCQTGSDGDGYAFARRFGHNIIDVVPALVPIELKDKDIRLLQGVSLKNVSLSARCGKKIHSQFGEMLFTDKGISGPIVLTLSSLINRENVDELWLDLKPALTHEKLDARLVREFDNAKNKNLKSVMATLMIKSMIEPFLKRVSLSGERKINSITEAERARIVKGLKCWTLDYKMLYPIETGIVTSGGVDLKQIDPKTMQSKLVSGLYFIGEVLDIDALTGGFNLQIAFSTAFAASSDF